MRVAGLMSGTSMDAIDAAAADIELRGDVLELRPLGSLRKPYPDDLREELAAALAGPTTLAAVCRLDTRIGQAFAELAAAAAERFGAELIASHGQTLFHWVEGEQVAGTLQAGQPAWIAERTGLPVVADLRPRDVAAGGQGAPLVALFDALWLAGRPGVPAALNLGGIANLTVVPPAGAAGVAGAARAAGAAGAGAAGAAGAPIAFDVGPGNALLDAAARRFTGAPYDAGGRLAAAGRVLPGLLERLLADPYYARPAPKSTGKEHFNAAYLDAEGRPEDVLATLTRLTARTVADAARRHSVTEVIASGGGVRNPALMQALAEELGATTLTTSDALGIPAQDKEAYAFAVLGYLTFHGLPGTLPSATGARHASVLGSITPGVAHLTQVREPALQPRTLLIR